MFTPQGGAAVSWQPLLPSAGPILPGTWLRTTFPSPSAQQLPVGAALLINASGLGRGRFYVNGCACDADVLSSRRGHVRAPVATPARRHDVGRYWTVLGYKTDRPCQIRYYVPPDWLAPPGQTNVLVAVELQGGAQIDPRQVVVEVVREERV